MLSWYPGMEVACVRNAQCRCGSAVNEGEIHIVREVGFIPETFRNWPYTYVIVEKFPNAAFDARNFQPLESLINTEIQELTQTLKEPCTHT